MKNLKTLNLRRRRSSSSVEVVEQSDDVVDVVDNPDDIRVSRHHKRCNEFSVRDSLQINFLTSRRFIEFLGPAGKRSGAGSG